MRDEPEFPARSVHHIHPARVDSLDLQRGLQQPLQGFRHGTRGTKSKGEITLQPKQNIRPLPPGDIFHEAFQYAGFIQFNRDLAEEEAHHDGFTGLTAEMPFSLDPFPIARKCSLYNLRPGFRIDVKSLGGRSPVDHGGDFLGGIITQDASGLRIHFD